MINSIQYLRAIAAFLVVYYHSTIKATQNSIPDATIFYIGESGVDLFFIISGFIICFVTDKKDFHWLQFLKLRVLRIIPLYWFFSLIALGAFLVVPSLVNSSGGETSIFESFFLIPTESKYLIQNGWTLSYEFYFYIICSALLILNLNKKWLLAVLCVLPCFHLMSNTYFFFDWYLLEFAMGVFSYLIYTQKATIKMKVFICFAIFSLYLILSFYLDLSNRVIEYGLPMWLIFNVGLLINQLLDRYSTSRALKILHALGDSSYSLYLAHTFSLVFLNKIYGLIVEQGDLYTYLLFLVGTSLFIGQFVYVYIEKPLNSYVRKLCS